ncbi:MAG TPA: hypothetical protein VLI41_13900 [Phenylobacterium sp.]|uniref:hypothetical protein n=1 Tax=Phenylobacterium sp. TaxID=1871053 RepID=UPI002B5F5084|nr:hypothetical protein [Phenylobacterium sp.]HSV04287.1 hypothetical protein [Phenylobacterium sp.]
MRGGRVREHRESAPIRHAAVFLLLAALMLRAAIPAGWMPNTAGLVDSPLVICMGSSAHDHGGPSALPGAPHRPHRHGVCAFASLGAPLKPPALVLAAAPLTAIYVRADFAADRVPPASQRRRPQSARGPPLQV